MSYQEKPIKSSTKSLGIAVILSFVVVFSSDQVRYRARRSYPTAVLVLNLHFHGIEAVQTGPVVAPVLLTLESSLLSRLHREVLRERTPGFQGTWRDRHLTYKFYH